MAHQNNEHTYIYRIHDEAYEQMIRILRFPQVTGREMNGEVCRVRFTHDLQLSLKRDFWEQYTDDAVLQVRLLHHADRDFVVMRSMLEQVPNEVAVSTIS